jgi:hypothetical protein
VKAEEQWSVYQCDLLGRGQTPKNEVQVASGFATPRAAMTAANALKRANPNKSYTVGCGE